MKMLFVLFAGFLLAAGCSESDSPEFEQSRRLVRNLYLAPVMSVYAGQTLTLQGVGFEAGDVVSFRADAAVFDLPVSGVTAKTARVVMVAILDADKEGFLRSERSLIQTIGRAARNSEGKVILYADRITDSMKRAMDETSRRRAKQDKYNKEHGIIPRTIIKPVSEVLEISRPVKETGGKMDIADVKAEIARLEKEMLKAAKELDFEAAAKYRDALKLLRLGIED